MKQTSKMELFKMELFAKIDNGFKPLTILAKSSILDVCFILYPPLNRATKYMICFDKMLEKDLSKCGTLNKVASQGPATLLKLSLFKHFIKTYHFHGFYTGGTLVAKG